MPFLYLFLPTNSNIKPRVYFIIHKQFQIVLVGKASIDMHLMLGYPPFEVSGYTRIERGLVFVGEYVYDSL